MSPAWRPARPHCVPCSRRVWTRSGVLQRVTAGVFYVGGPITVSFAWEIVIFVLDCVPGTSVHLDESCRGTSAGTEAHVSIAVGAAAIDPARSHTVEWNGHASDKVVSRWRQGRVLTRKPPVLLFVDVDISVVQQYLSHARCVPLTNSQMRKVAPAEATDHEGAEVRVGIV